VWKDLQNQFVKDRNFYKIFLSPEMKIQLKGRMCELIAEVQGESQDFEGDNADL
jgi:hypothetical protein